MSLAGTFFRAASHVFHASEPNVPCPTLAEPLPDTRPQGNKCVLLDALRSFQERPWYAV